MSSRPPQQIALKAKPLCCPERSAFSNATEAPDQDSPALIHPTHFPTQIIYITWRESFPRANSLQVTSGKPQRKFKALPKGGDVTHYLRAVTAPACR